jgi:beta-hydroxyacyl-ACP dehydratase FabZ
MTPESTTEEQTKSEPVKHPSGLSSPSWEIGGPEQRYDIEYIQELIKHRYPFLLLDRILKIEADYIEALKNVTINEPFFQGHFPGHPVMPGVLIVEAIAQAGCVMLSNYHRSQRLIYLAGVNNARFKRPVVPGDSLVLQVRCTQMRRNLGKAMGKALVDGKVVAEAEILFADTTDSR